ncbi:aminodeoxyfutalosine deaminase [Deinococcus piscis]|uniref:Aminodeoxyfutalosine deaminase n=1 Tax=Deinococcus piscis TaxID=394230 RepID=A0ABQ3K5S6_9DEIO|nr:amidohydrolase family protein [Deinococcus piscis]GHG05009.1 aminodeoxyfutalosine deaminase [Deinococcus piscis]
MSEPQPIGPADFSPVLYTADTLFTGLGGAQSPGGVVVSRGTVAATGHPDQLRQNYPHAREVDAGGIIAPLPANAHTHLDMSAYRFQALPYFRWIPEVVVAQKAQRGLAGALAGADTLVRLGQPVGDIVWDPAVMEALLPREDLRGVLYLEVLGPKPEQAQERFAQFREQVEGFRRLERPGGLRVGVSPHASYTVSAPLLRLVTEYAAGEGLPVQIHVAEHPSETELFASGAGPLWEHRIPGLCPDTFAEVMGRTPEPDLTPVRYLDELGVLRHRPTLVHMVNVSDDDIRRVAEAGCAVVSCPRSNVNLDCGRLRLSEFLAAGVEVALGTDSVASGETLDIRDELAFARQLYPELDPRLLLRSAVKGGARVLGLPVPQIRRGLPWREEYLWQHR